MTEELETNEVSFGELPSVIARDERVAFLKDLHDELDQLNLIYNDFEHDPLEWGRAYLRREEVLYILWDHETLPSLQKSVTPQIVLLAAHEVLTAQVNRYRNYRLMLYAQYELDRKNGVPFPERRKKLEAKKPLLDICDKREQEALRCLSNLRPRPIGDWLRLRDYDLLKSWGLRKFISFLSPEEYLMSTNA